jgi:hypothetical protein
MINSMPQTFGHACKTPVQDGGPATHVASLTLPLQPLSIPTRTVTNRPSPFLALSWRLRSNGFRRLNLDDRAELVTSYQADATVYELATKFGIHRHTSASTCEHRRSVARGWLNRGRDRPGEDHVLHPRGSCLGGSTSRGAPSCRHSGSLFVARRAHCERLSRARRSCSCTSPVTAFNLAYAWPACWAMSGRKVGR